MSRFLRQEVVIQTWLCRREAFSCSALTLWCWWHARKKSSGRGRAGRATNEPVDAY